ncbi:MAG: T9SS type A sorting domain-containing protein [Saprospiraceae bacterium]|nr:T9SS type A sorting domain-containing protein [Saprospiraceae bacterium]
MKKLNLIFIFLLAMNFSFSQNGWIDKSPNTTANINDIYFVSVNTGFAVCDSGEIYKTTNGGDNWTFQYSGVTNNLNGVFFVSSQKGYVVGDAGKILVTTNGGTNWSITTLTTPFALEDVYFNNPDSGIIVGNYNNGGYFIVTFNGGTSWNQDGPVPGTEFRSVQQTNDTTAVTVGYMSGSSTAVIGKITLNTTYTIKGNLGGNQFNNVHFPSTTGYVCGNTGIMFKSTNSGDSWSYLTGTSGLGSNNIYSIYFVNDTIGFAGSAGKIFRTINGASSWVQQYNSGTSNFKNIHFVDDVNGYACGGLKVLKTSSAGVNLTISTTDTSVVCSDTVLLITNTSYSGTGSLVYTWSPTSSLCCPTINSPNAYPTTTTTYYVTVTDGVISANDSVTVTVLDLPLNAGTDTSTYCKEGIQLNASVSGITGVNYSWSPSGSLNNTLIHNPVSTPTMLTKYFVTATRSVCSAIDSVEVDVIPLPTDSICLVSVDDSLNKNLVIFERNVVGNIDYYKIYRESNVSGIYDSIGIVPADSAGLFIDTASNPAVQAESYKISIVDSCGFESVMSDFHTTMHLNINQGTGSSWNLLWNQYIGFQVVTYYIWRGDSTHNLVLIDSVPGTSMSYSDLSPPAGLLYYQVEILAPHVCHPYAKSKANTNYNSSRSNQAANMVNTLQANFSGNPTSGISPLSVQFNDLTTGGPNTWLWDFGDGNTSTLKNPSHIYSTIGSFDVKLKASNGIDTDSITIVSYITVASGINENYLKKYIKIFPNPFSDETNILIENPNISVKTIELLDISGKKIISIEKPESNKITIHRNGLESGLYFIKITTENEFILRDKIIVR